MTPRILVVDRNQAFAAMLQEMLESEGGYSVVVTHSGSGALAQLSQGSFELTCPLHPALLPFPLRHV